MTLALHPARRYRVSNRRHAAPQTDIAGRVRTLTRLLSVVVAGLLVWIVIMGVSLPTADSCFGSSSRSFWRRPAHGRNPACAVFRAAFDHAIPVGNINQDIAVSIEQANYVERVEDEAAPLVEDAFDVFNVLDNIDTPDLAARYTGVAGVFCDTQSALDASGLRSRYVAGDALDLGIVETIDHNLVVGPEQAELCTDRSGRAALRPADDQQGK